MSSFDLLKLPEPRLLFGGQQALEDPRDGLTLFGPLDAARSFGIRPAVVGTADGIRRFRQWVGRVQIPIDDKSRSRPFFPGFEAVFGVPFAVRPAHAIELDHSEILNACQLADRHQRVFQVVNLYVDQIKRTIASEEGAADVWFVVVPDEVYQYCRPQSVVEPAVRRKAATAMSPGLARRILSSPSLFADMNQDAQPYGFEPNFHNQLKAVLLSAHVPTQIVRESTLAPDEFVDAHGRATRGLGKASEIAWNICTTAYYKTGARPWKTADIREGVCYLGLVFKRDHRSTESRWSSCGAQMFLDSGDGFVFKGTGGPWFSSEYGSFHLDRAAAKDLMQKAVNAYTAHVGRPPRELFVHGKVRFDSDEWSGFLDAVTPLTTLVGVRIRRADDLRIYTRETRAVLRGLAYIHDSRTAYLWAGGFIPRLGTYPGREVPKALLVDVCRGQAQIETVLADVLALTKLNYNACIYGDGEPVTLSFADAVGEILTSGPVAEAPLPFKLYI